MLNITQLFKRGVQVITQAYSSIHIRYERYMRTGVTELMGFSRIVVFLVVAMFYGVAANI